MTHISALLPSVVADFTRDRGCRRVAIQTADERVETVYGMLSQAVEAGLLTSMHDVLQVKVNGRLVSHSEIL